MLPLLSLHAIAARRGDGLHPSRRRNHEAQRPGDCEVDDQLELGRVYTPDRRTVQNKRCLKALRLCKSEPEQMTVSGISHYRGGTIDEVAPLARKLKAVYLKHGVAYRLSRFQTGPNAGDWFVVVQYAD